MDDTYNGWKNYPTWNVNLWLDEYGARDDAIRYAAEGERSLHSFVESLVWPDERSSGLDCDLLGWALDMVDWTGLVKHLSPCHYAYERGTDDGRAAASWYFDGNTDDETYRRVWRGLEDGDPAVLDTFPRPDLSGGWADALTGPALVRDALDAVGWSDPDETGWFHDICEAYETAFADAVDDEIRCMVKAHFMEHPERAVDETDPSDRGGRR